jgi:calcium/calmodulin-dependent protein kinase I
LLQIFEDNSFIYLVLEYQPKGSLLDMIEDCTSIPETTSRVIME